jgi:1,4-dihydroxy-2-naphthoate polyprenyltransferase
MRLLFSSLLKASRPKTLPASIAPVLIGTVIAYSNGYIHIFITIITLLAAIGIQIGTNYANDYFDFKNGADTEKRIGPARMTQNGFIKPVTMKYAFIICFLITAILGLILLIRGGWPIFWIGVISIILGIIYTGGPFPLGYHGMGDILVLIFFGPVAVAGTYYLQALDINLTVVAAGFAPGLLSMAILTINNLRDIKSDAETGKRTLAVIWGADFARKEYFYSITLACLIPIIISICTFSHFYLIIASVITFILALPLFHKVVHNPIDAGLNKVLEQTGKLLIIYAVIFSICWVI